jgi:hypothetical protein
MMRRHGVLRSASNVLEAFLGVHEGHDALNWLLEQQLLQPKDHRQQ